MGLLLLGICIWVCYCYAYPNVLHIHMDCYACTYETAAAMHIHVGHRHLHMGCYAYTYETAAAAMHIHVGHRHLHVGCYANTYGLVAVMQIHMDLLLRYLYIYIRVCCCYTYTCGPAAVMHIPTGMLLLLFPFKGFAAVRRKSIQMQKTCEDVRKYHAW